MRARGIAVWILATAGVFASCRSGDEAEPPWVEAQGHAVEAPGISFEPLSFEPNLGMTDPAVRFVARSKQTTIYMTDDSLVLVAWEPPVAGEPPILEEPPEGSVVRIAFEGANPSSFEPQAPLAGVSHYFLGSDPSQWHSQTEVPHYERIVAHDLYPGIDLVVHGNESHELQYDFVVSPGADPSAISMRIDSTESPLLDSRRNLRIPAGSGFLEQRAPVVFQDIGGVRKPVSGRYALDARRVTFELGEFDRGEPLVIDPSIAWALELSPPAPSLGDFAVDAEGAVFVFGSTPALDFPVQNPLQQTLAGAFDAYLTKVAPDGSGFLFSTFFGGSLTDIGAEVAVSASGEPVVVGWTESSDFPIANAFQPAFGGIQDGFIARFSPTGDQLVFSTFAGGSGVDLAYRVALGAAGDAAVTGLVGSSDFPTTPGAPYRAHSSGSLVSFVMRVSPSGALTFSTYFGEDNQLVLATDVAVDAAGATYLVGMVFAGGSLVPVNAIQPFFGGSVDGFITKFSSSGIVEFTTFIGDADTDVLSLVVVGAGSIHVAGTESNPDDVVLRGLSSDGATLEYAVRLSTLLGLAPAAGEFIGLHSLGDELVACGTFPGAGTYPGGIHVPGLLVENLNEPYPPEGFIARIGHGPTAIESWTILWRAARCTLDPSGNLYLGEPYLEPASPGEVPTRAWLVKLTDLRVADDQYEVDEDASLVVAAPGVLANDDPGDAVLVQAPSHAASFSLAPDGSFSYSPALDFSGADSFRYRVRAGSSSSATATVTLLVRPQPDSPVANADAYIVDAGGQLSVPAPGVIANDTDVDGDSLTAVLVSGPSHGSLALQLDGSFLYEPAPAFSGNDQFQYAASDGALQSPPAVVVLRVGAVDAPQAFITSGPEGLTNDVTVTFAFSADPPTATFQCQLDAAAFEPCSSPLSLGPLAFGEHRVVVRGVAPSGAVDVTPAERVFTVTPDTLFASVPPSRSTILAATFEFTSNDPAATFECSAEGAAFLACASPAVFDPVAEGSHTFRVRAIHGGALGPLADHTPALHAYEVDRTGPILSLVSPQDGASTALTPLVATIAVNEEALVTASSVFPAGTLLAPGTRTVSIPLRPGYNTFSTFVRDDLGNSSLFTFHLFLDSEPPRLTFLDPQSGDSTYFAPRNVLVSLSEDVTVVTSSPGFLPTGALPGGEKTLRLSLDPGLNTFEATLRDRAGNEAVFSVAEGTAFRLSLSATRPPAPAISTPTEGAAFTARLASVTGTVSGNATTVRITGASTVTVPVLGGGAWSGTVALTDGENRIRAVARSDAGATSPEASVLVTVAAGSRHVAVSAGDGQLAPTATTLPLPLSARVTSTTGAALEGVLVTFILVAEPVSADGSLPDGKTATAVTDAGGVAAVPLRLASSHVDANGVLQPTLVTATVASQSGGTPIFAAQGLPTASFGGGGTPTYLIPIGRDCRSVPGSPVGSCPLASAGSAVSGFAVGVLDQAYRLLAGAEVDFVAARGAFSNGASTIHLQAGSDGIARTGAFTLSQTIPNAEDIHLMIRPDDLAATPAQEHLVTASLTAIPSVTMGFVAYAHAGPPARVVDVSPAATVDYPEIPATSGLIGRVEDQYANPVANAALTFSVMPVAGDPLDPGPRVFRSDPSASSAGVCTHRLPRQGETCTAGTLSATTFADGRAWSQMTLGKRSATTYQVRGSAPGTSPIFFERTTIATYIPRRFSHVLQASLTAAATFGIVGTENDDTDPFTAVLWAYACEGALPNQVCTSGRSGPVMTFETEGATSGAFFNPRTATAGQQTTYGVEPQPVGLGEVSSLFNPGESPAGGEGQGNLLLGVWVSGLWAGPRPTIATPGRQELPAITVEFPQVTLGCALSSSTLTPGAFCDPEHIPPPPSPDSTPCTAADPGTGVTTFIDLGNGGTENNVMVVRVLHPGTSPVAGRLAVKFQSQLIAVSSVAGVPQSEHDNYFSLRRAMRGVPGIYPLGAANALPMGQDGETPLKFLAEQDGCAEFVAMSYVAPSSFAPISAPPQRPKLDFAIDGEHLVEIAFPGPAHGWVDEVRRERRGPREGTRISGGDGVADWLQMAAWDFLENPPEGPLVAPPDGFQPNTVFLSKEIEEVLSEPLLVSSVYRVNPIVKFDSNGDLIFIQPPYAATCPGSFLWQDGDLPQCDNSSPFNPEIRVNMSTTGFRTGEFDLAYVPDNYDLDHECVDILFCTLAHEARHAWQFALVRRFKEIAQNDPPLGPFNDDDQDLLPELARLADGETSLQGPTGSARGIIDRFTNFVLDSNGAVLATFSGDGVNDGVMFDPDRLPRNIAIERDAIRFGRTIDAPYAD